MSIIKQWLIHRRSLKKKNPSIQKKMKTAKGRQVRCGDSLSLKVKPKVNLSRRTLRRLPWEKKTVAQHCKLTTWKPSLSAFIQQSTASLFPQVALYHKWVLYRLVITLIDFCEKVGSERRPGVAERTGTRVQVGRATLRFFFFFFFSWLASQSLWLESYQSIVMKQIYIYLYICKQKKELAWQLI